MIQRLPSPPTAPTGLVPPSLFDVAATEPATPEPSTTEPEALGVDPPLVTGILAFGRPDVLRRIPRCIEQFMQQDYRRKQLFIVNATGQPLQLPETPALREILTTPEECPTVAALRNLAIRQVDEGWIVPWDDDDICHPHRLTFQMAHRRPGYCVVLSNHIRIDLQNVIIASVGERGGQANTILFPRSVDMLYDSQLPSGENVDLLNRFFDHKVVVKNESGFPGPAYQLACWHVRNVLPREIFMGPFASLDNAQRQLPGVDDIVMQYIAGMMQAYKLQVQFQRQKQPVENTENGSKPNAEPGNNGTAAVRSEGHTKLPD